MKTQNKVTVILRDGQIQTAIASLDIYFRIFLGQYDDLLTQFFTQGINPELPINAHRYSTDDVPEGVPIYGFEWYLHPNFYTYSDMDGILNHMAQLAGELRNGSTYSAGIIQKRRLRSTFAQVAEYDPELSFEDAMKATAEFYEKLICRIRQMMEACSDTDIICVMAP